MHKMDHDCHLSSCLIIPDHEPAIYEPDVIQFVVDNGNNSTAKGDPKATTTETSSSTNLHSQLLQWASASLVHVYKWAAIKKTASIQYKAFDLIHII